MIDPGEKLRLGCRAIPPSLSSSTKPLFCILYDRISDSERWTPPRMTPAIEAHAPRQLHLHSPTQPVDWAQLHDRLHDHIPLQVYPHRFCRPVSVRACLPQSIGQSLLVVPCLVRGSLHRQCATMVDISVLFALVAVNFCFAQLYGRCSNSFVPGTLDNGSQQADLP